MDEAPRSPSTGMLRHALAPILAGALYFAIAYGTLQLGFSRGGVAPFWFANAALIVIALLRPRVETFAIVAAGALANIGASLSSGGELPASLFYALANCTELTLAVIGLKCLPDRKSLSDPSSVVQFLLWGGLVAPLAGAPIAAAGAWYLLDLNFADTAMRWFLADALGLLIFTPLAFALANGDVSRQLAQMTRNERIEFGALMGFAALCTWTVFFAAKHPALFFISVPMILVAFRSGWLGTKVALMIVAVLGGTATLTGHGPILLIASDPNQQFYYFQIFLAVMLLIQLPLATTLAARDAVIDQLTESEKSLRLLASQSHILLLSMDLNGRCERIVGSGEIILDSAPGDLIGGSFADISHDGQYELHRAHEAALEDVERSHIAEFRTQWPQDAWLEAVFRAQFDAHGRCVGTIATIHDVTLRKNQEINLSRSATTDSLTGLLNRAGFLQRLEAALHGAEPGSLSLAVIDVDRFKFINDNLGHQVGDVVLREIAERISGQVRSGDAVARLGGDEFVVLLATPNWKTVEDICNRIVRSVQAEPVAAENGGPLRATISCGVTRLRKGLTPDQFINEADLALYQAKRNGRNRVAAA